MAGIKLFLLFFLRRNAKKTDCPRSKKTRPFVPFPYCNIEKPCYIILEPALLF